jgi:Organic solute transporter Ostalpha
VCLFCLWRALRPHSPLKTRLPSRAQRYIIRLLIMPIMYSSMSAAALQVGLPNAIYYETMRDWCVRPPANTLSLLPRARPPDSRLCARTRSYESWIIYNFLTLCFAYVGGPGEVVTAQEGKSVHPSCVHGTCCLPTMTIDSFFLRGCKQGALQFVILKPFMAITTLFLEGVGLYADGEFRADRGYAYLAFMYNICYTVALYALLLFYVAAADLLRPHKPILKFVVVKSVVFLTFWQSLACSFMVNLGILYDGEEARKLQNFLICVEMVLASTGLIFAFPYKTYYAGAPDSFYEAVWHAASIADVWSDMKHQFESKYVGYILYSEDTQAAPKRHYIRERMDAAMLAAALAVRHGAEGVANVVKEGKLGEIMRDGVLDLGREIKSGVLEVAALTKDGRLGGLVLENVKHIGEATLDGVTKVSHGVVDGVTKLDALARRVVKDGDAVLGGVGAPISAALGLSTPGGGGQAGGHHPHGSGGSDGKGPRRSIAGPYGAIGAYDSFRRHSHDGPGGASMRLRAAAVAAAVQREGVDSVDELGQVEMQSVSLDEIDPSEAARLIEDAWGGNAVAISVHGHHRSGSNIQQQQQHLSGAARCLSPPRALPPPADESAAMSAIASPRVLTVAAVLPSEVTDADFDGVRYRYTRPVHPGLRSPRMSRNSNSNSGDATASTRGGVKVAVPPLFAPEPLPWRGITVVPLDDPDAMAAAAAATAAPPPVPPPEFELTWAETTHAVASPHHHPTPTSQQQPQHHVPPPPPPPPPLSAHASAPAATAAPVQSRRAALLAVAVSAPAAMSQEEDDEDDDVAAGVAMEDGEEEEQCLSPVVTGGSGRASSSWQVDEFATTPSGAPPSSTGPPPPPPEHGQDDNPFE